MITKKVFIITILFIEFLFLGYSTAYDYSIVGKKEFGQPKKIFQEDRLYAGSLGALLNFENNEEYQLKIDSIKEAKERELENNTITITASTSSGSIHICNLNQKQESKYRILLQEIETGFTISGNKFTKGLRTAWNIIK